MKKKMCKAAMATVLASLVLTGTNPVLAEENTKSDYNNGPGDVKRPTAPAGAITEQQAIQKVRDMFGGLNELDQANAHYTQDGRTNGKPAWQVYCFRPAHRESGASGAPNDYFSATLDAMTGELLDFSQQKNAWMGTQEPTKDLAMAKASEFLQTYLPNLAKRVKLSGMNGGGAVFANGTDGEEYRWTHSTVAFHEMVNGIPFVSNAIYINVDQYGHVVGMNANFGYDTSKLPDPAKAMKPEQAQELYAKKLTLHKQYITGVQKKNDKGDYEWEKRPMLTYDPTRWVEFDAITGEDVSHYYRSQLEEPNKMYSVVGVGKKLAATSKEEAKSIVGDLLQIDLSKLQFREEKEQRAPLNDDVWRFSWMEQPTPDNTRLQYVQATFDAKTGQLLYASKNSSAYTGQQPAFSLSGGEGQAVETLRQYLPSGSQELFLNRAQDEKQWDPAPEWYVAKPGEQRYDDRRNSYSYSFDLGHQGVPVRDHGYSVTIDASTGQIIALGLAHPNQLSVELPDNVNTASPEAAEAVFMKETPLMLAYQWDRFDDQIAPQGQLVYMLDTPNSEQRYLDALTGQMVYPERTKK